jgi:hypothetical protein
MPTKSALKSIAPIGKLTAKSSALIKPKAPPPAATQGRPFPNPAGFTYFPQGPALLKLGVARDTNLHGPGEKPVDFEGSQPEWVWYWASMRRLNPKEDPRKPPFDGGDNGSWMFADPIGATQAPREAGITTPDFIYLQPSGGVIVVRIEGFYWHVAAEAAVQARDLYLMTHFGSGRDRVVRVDDGEYMHDDTGATAIALLSDILAEREPVGRLGGGIAQAPRYADFAR